MSLPVFRIFGTACTMLAAIAGMGAANARTPDGFAGLWRLDPVFTPGLRTVDGSAPPLLPEAAATYRERQALYRNGDLSFDRSSAICVSPGMPRIMALPYPFRIVAGSTHVAFLFEWNNRHRLIDITGTTPDIPDLFYMGTASGRFEGNVLTIETRGLTDSTLLDAKGMPHSSELVITERLSLAGDGDLLVDEMTIEDPQTFSQPWTTRFTYRRMPPSARIAEDVCRERIAAGRPAFEYDRWDQTPDTGSGKDGRRTTAREGNDDN